MENDHLADAILFLRSVINCLNVGRPVDRFDIDRAIEEIKKEQSLATSQKMKDAAREIETLRTDLDAWERAATECAEEVARLRLNK